MKLRELLKDVNVTELCADAELDVTGVSYDSRQCAPGGLFVAVTGYETDGHRFIEAAVRAGAVCVLCERKPDIDIPYVLTDNTRLGLAVVSRSFFGDPAAGMTMIGVTGTNGKTTVTTLIKHMLECCLGAKVGLIGSISNYIGDEELHTDHTTPESYELQRLLRLMADAGCTHVVMEVSSHALMLDRVAGIRYSAAVFTNLSQDHLDFHKTMASYAEAKTLLFAQSDAVAINLDDDWADFMLSRAHCHTLTYSAEKNEAALVAKDVRLLPDCVKFCAVTIGGIERVSLNIPGRFSVYNALSVISAGMLLGVDMHAAAVSLASAKGVKGRVEQVPTDGDYSIFIDYAVTPDAIENVLTTLREVCRGRLVIVFGCGGDRDRKKRPIMASIAADNADFVVVTSDNPRTEEPQAIIDEILPGLAGKKTPYVAIVDRSEAIAWAIDNHKPGDLILLCGKGHETYQIIGKVKHHMDEREIVAGHLEKRKLQRK